MQFINIKRGIFLASFHLGYHSSTSSVLIFDDGGLGHVSQSLPPQLPPPDILKPEQPAKSFFEDWLVG